jgi:hypothetical protein
MNTLLSLMILSTALADEPKATPAGGYYKMKAVSIVDEQGFGQPVEVARLLIPADWSAEGGVQWEYSQLRCPANIIKPRFRAVSPDRRSAFEVLPGYTWQTATDPMMQQILRHTAASGQGCDVGPVLDSGGYLRQSVLSMRQPNARLIGHEPMPAVSQAKQEQLAPSFQPLIRAGYMLGFRTDTSAIRVTYDLAGQGAEEWITTSVTSLAMPSANTAALMQGQMNMSAATYTMMADPAFVLRMPAGRFDRKLAALIVASIRPNPRYQAAVSHFLANMNNIAVRGAADRARIWREASQQVSATIQESYRQQQAVQDRTAAQFSEHIRGVETYLDPKSGRPVELTGGFDSAWVNNRGEYLLSDSPGFNPAVALREDWSPMKRIPPR